MALAISAMPVPGLAAGGVTDADQSATARKLDALDYVHLGRDGELFFAGFHQRLIQSYAYSANSLWTAWCWQRLIAERTRHATENGAALTLMIVPEKLTIYPDRVTGHPLDPGAGLAGQVTRALRWSGQSAAVLDLVVPFRAARDRIGLYLETDSHWTHAGGHLAYTELCRRFGVTPRPHLAEGYVLDRIPFCGDLGARCRPPRTETVAVRDLARDAQRIAVNSLLRTFEERGEPLLVGEGAGVIYRNPSPEADPRRVVIFGDSYCHHSTAIRSAPFTQFLAETFREVHFVWSKSYDPNFVAWVRPDIVLCEIAERYLFSLPPATFSLDELERRLLTADRTAHP